MADPTAKPSDAQSLPDNAAGQPMPRRTSPDKSVTLQHHRLVRDASLRNAASRRSAQSSQVPTISIHKDVDASPTRGSSSESQDTTQSDAMRWFDRSNENPTAAYTQGMDGMADVPTMNQSRN